MALEGFRNRFLLIVPEWGRATTLMERMVHSLKCVQKQNSEESRCQHPQNVLSNFELRVCEYASGQKAMVEVAQIDFEGIRKSFQS
jgi:hypothetical protein